MNLFEPVNKSYWLSRLCEANYDRLLELIPELECLPGCIVAIADGNPPLHLTILERSPYTLTLELTHNFGWNYEALWEPAVTIRVYLDARAAEMLRDHARPLVTNAMKPEASIRDVMDYKWSLNYFLSRWLNHCLQHDYRFRMQRKSEEILAVEA